MMILFTLAFAKVEIKIEINTFLKNYLSQKFSTLGKVL